MSAQFGSADAIYDLREYPYWSILAALLLFTMGGAYWGGCYAFAAGFAVLSVLLAWYPAAGVIGFGGMWSACLAGLGLHFRRLGSEPGRAVSRQPDAEATCDPSAVSHSNADEGT